MLDRAGVAVAEGLGLLGDRQALREIIVRAFVLGRHAGEELNAELHFRHPEVAAERPSKGDGPNVSAASFEARSARTSG